jgi:hypothetical protein
MPRSIIQASSITRPSIPRIFTCDIHSSCHSLTDLMACKYFELIHFFTKSNILIVHSKLSDCSLLISLLIHNQNILDIAMEVMGVKI